MLKLSLIALLLCLGAQSSFAIDCSGALNSPQIATVRLPLSQLMESGVSEVQFSPEIVALLENESEILGGVSGTLDNWDAPKFDAVRASFARVNEIIAQEVLRDLKKNQPEYTWTYLKGNGRGQSQGPMPTGAHTSMIHPNKYIEEWHQDMNGTEAEVAKNLFLKNKLDKFVLRMTIALPFAEMPSTWAKPIRGLQKGVPIQVARHLGVAFIMNFITHSTPQFDGIFRYLYLFDFEAVKKDLAS